MEIWTSRYIQVTSLNFRGRRDVIGCVAVGPGMSGFLYVFSNNHPSIFHTYGDNEPQRYCGSHLDNAGHVTLPLFDTPGALSYWRSVVTMYQPWTVIEIWSLKDIRVTILTFGVTWCHQLRDHSSPHGVFPIGGQWWPDVYLARLLRYSAWNIIAVTTLTFGLTWRHRSRDHPTPHGVFPIGAQWRPDVYLARLLRYSASKIFGSRLWAFGVTWRHRSRDH